MNEISLNKNNNKTVAAWLLIGVGMIVIQVMLGGITRLTESGLSITEWKPITGVLPPLGDAAWQIEFDKYKATDQFKFVHQNFSITNFKFIFFWEWFHRLWARLMGLVFLIGFFYFLIKKQFNKSMILPMVVLFFLGAIQGAIGWIMVKSGLVPEKYFVGHIELTTHFIAALGLLCYTLWFALSLLISPSQKIQSPSLKYFLYIIIFVLVIQLIYGGFMAGLKAAASAPTWPTINGSMAPITIHNISMGAKNWFFNPIAVQFIHRGLAYILAILITAWFVFSKKIMTSKLFSKLRLALFFIVCVQIILGVLTVLNATHPNRLICFGVLHQFVAMLLLITIIGLLFILGGKNKSIV